MSYTEHIRYTYHCLLTRVCSVSPANALLTIFINEKISKECHVGGSLDTTSFQINRSKSKSEVTKV